MSTGATSTAPRYRADIAGQVATIKAECAAQMRNEIATSDEFVLLPEDTSAWSEYADYLTEAERRACFRSARA